MFQSNTILYFAVVMLLFSVAVSDDELWAEAVIAVARQKFIRPVILFLDFSDPILPYKCSTLLPEKIVDGESLVLKILGESWSIINSNKDVKSSEDDFRTYRLGLVRARQVVAILGDQAIHNTTQLTQSVRSWRQNSVWYSRSKILVVVEAKKKDAAEIAFRIIKELWTQGKSPNVVVLVSHKKKVSLFKYKPYSPGCDVKSQFVREWKKGDLANVPIFQNHRYLNLHKCVLTGAPAVMEPFLFPKKNNKYYEGIEIRIFETLSKHLNFTINYQEIPGENPWISSINGTPSGMVGQLYRHEADITISGNRLTFERAQFVDSIDSYFSDDFTWIGPAARNTPPWKAVFLVFRFDMWISLLVFYIFSIIVFMILNRGKHESNKSDSFLIMCAANMNNVLPSSYIKSTTVIRLFFACYLCFAITVNAIYTSGLYQVLSQGLKLDLIDSARDGIDNGLTASIDVSNVQDFEDIMPELYNEMVEKGLLDTKIEYLDCLDRAAKKGDCMALYPSLVARYDINTKFTLQSGKKLIHVMNNRYKSYEPVMYMTRHHPLLPVFRKKMRQLVESGWVRHQINTIMGISKRIGQRNFEVNRLYDERKRKELSIDQLLGAFLVSFVTIIFSLLTFIGEICWGKLQRKRKKDRLQNKKRTVKILKDEKIFIHSFENSF